MNYSHSLEKTYQSEKCLSPFALILIVLLEGFVTVSAQILTIRQLIPFFGNTVITTSVIIGVFLLFLAFGYRFGGTITKNFQLALTRNFIISSMIFSIGLSFLFIELFVSTLHNLLEVTPFFYLTTYLLIITAPLVFILGQTIPITMNLYKKSSRVSQIGGNLLYISTVGSFLGATVTSLVLLSFIGVAYTILFNCITLFVLIMLMQGNIKNIMVWYSVIGILVLCYYCNVTYEKSKFILANSYGNYAIEDKVITNDIVKREGKAFLINASYLNAYGNSFIDNNMKGYDYIEKVKKILFQELKIRNKDILILGAGGFTISAENTYDNRFTYVDIDKDVANITKKENFAPINGRFIATDARQYVRKHPATYDVIFSDVYSTGHSIPTQLVTFEFFMEIKKVLKGEGPAIFNIISNPQMKDAYSQHLDQTIKSVFPYCSSNPATYRDGRTNNIYVCFNAEMNRELYTDNLNRSSLEFGELLYKKE
tara:strand:- start:13143 stop:14591 length:1449 start_codon:yes stop_codon:yes gene_type:complete